MTPAELAEIERVCNAATVGPWLPQPSFSDDGDLWPLIMSPGIQIGLAQVYGSRNAEFIARSREWLPALVAEVRRLDRLIDMNAAIESEFVDGSPENMVAKRRAFRKAGDALAEAFGTVGRCESIKAALAAWREATKGQP